MEVPAISVVCYLKSQICIQATIPLNKLQMQ